MEPIALFTSLAALAVIGASSPVSVGYYEPGFQVNVGLGHSHAYHQHYGSHDGWRHHHHAGMRVELPYRPRLSDDYSDNTTLWHAQYAADSYRLRDNSLPIPSTRQGRPRSQPQTPIEPKMPTPEDPTVYYCESAGGYYPAIPECEGGWQEEMARPAE